MIDSKDMWIVTETEEDLPHPGFYGLHYYRTYFGNVSGERYVKAMHVVEGEFDALQSIAHMIRNTDDRFVVVAAGGGAAPSLDPFERFGIEHVHIAQDNDAGGVKFVGQLAEKTTGDAVSLSVFQWPEGTGVKDPDEAARTLGYSAWANMMVDSDRFDPLTRWLVDRAVEEIDKDRVPLDDKKHISGIAKEWGEHLHNRQESRAFARRVAELYDLDPLLLERDLRRGDESEDEFIEELRSAILECYTLVGQDKGMLKMMHKETGQPLQLPLDDPRGQAQALAPFHGSPSDFIRDHVGDPAFMSAEGEEACLPIAIKDKRYREYLNEAFLRMTRGQRLLANMVTLAQGVHCVVEKVSYVVNGSAVWRVTHAGDTIDVFRLEAPIEGEYIFFRHQGSSVVPRPEAGRSNRRRVARVTLRRGFADPRRMAVQAPRCRRPVPRCDHYEDDDRERI